MSVWQGRAKIGTGNAIWGGQEAGGEGARGGGGGGWSGILVCHAGCSKGGGPVAQVNGLLRLRVPQHHSNPAPHLPPVTMLNAL